MNLKLSILSLNPPLFHHKCMEHSSGISKGSLISLTSSRSTSINTVLAPSSGPPSTGSTTSILSVTNENRPQLAAARPKCNSILHLFGEWLFEAAHIGSEMWLQSLKSKLLSFFTSNFSQKILFFLKKDFF